MYLNTRHNRKKVERLSKALGQRFPSVFNSPIYSFLVLNAVVFGIIFTTELLILEVNNFEEFKQVFTDPSDDLVFGYLLLFGLNVIFIYGWIKRRASERLAVETAKDQAAYERAKAKWTTSEAD